MTVPRPSPEALLVYVRVPRVYLPHAPRARLTLYQALLPEDSGIYASLGRLRDADLYGCATVLALATVPSRETRLLFVVTELRPGAGDVEYARLVLPLVWFRVNRVVSYAYPLAAPAAGAPAPMLLADVHLSRRGAAPFACPLAPLKVVPTWEVPACMRPQGAPLSEPPPAAARGAGAAPPPAAPSVMPPEIDAWLDANLDPNQE
jgi:hypothetical protein